MQEVGVFCVCNQKRLRRPFCLSPDTPHAFVVASPASPFAFLVFFFTLAGRCTVQPRGAP